MDDNESVISECGRESEEQQRSFDSNNSEEMNDSAISAAGEGDEAAEDMNNTDGAPAAVSVPEKRGIIRHFSNYIMA